MERLAWKINPSNQASQQSAHEDRNRQMWRLLCTIWADHAARFDRGEAKFALVIDGDTSKSTKLGCGHPIGRIFGMGVAAFRIRLPDFQHRIRHRLAVSIHYPSANGDARIGGGTFRQVYALQPVKPDGEERANRL